MSSGDGRKVAVHVAWIGECAYRVADDLSDICRIVIILDIGVVEHVKYVIERLLQIVIECVEGYHKAGDLLAVDSLVSDTGAE